MVLERHRSIEQFLSTNLWQPRVSLHLNLSIELLANNRRRFRVNFVRKLLVLLFLPVVSLASKPVKMDQLQFDSETLSFMRQKIEAVPVDRVQVRAVKCELVTIVNQGTQSQRVQYRTIDTSNQSTVSFEHVTPGPPLLRMGARYVVVGIREDSSANLIYFGAAELGESANPERVILTLRRKMKISTPSLEYVPKHEAKKAMAYVLPPSVTIRARPAEVRRHEIQLFVEVTNNGESAEHVVVMADLTPLHIRLIETKNIKYKPRPAVPPEPPAPHRFLIEGGQTLEFTRTIQKSELDFKPGKVTIEWEFLSWNPPHPKGNWVVSL